MVLFKLMNHLEKSPNKINRGHNNFIISWPINITLLSISDVGGKLRRSRLVLREARPGSNRWWARPGPRRSGTKECQTSRGPTRHVGTSTIPCVSRCFCSIHLCNPHKWILWDSKVPSDWDKCPLGHLPQACSWSPWLTWLCSSSGGCYQGSPIPLCFGKGFPC